jgi:hypothetical protein
LTRKILPPPCNSIALYWQHLCLNILLAISQKRSMPVGRRARRGS